MQLLPWAVPLLLAGLPHLLAGQQSLAGLQLLFTIQTTDSSSCSISEIAVYLVLMQSNSSAKRTTKSRGMQVTMPAQRCYPVCVMEVVIGLMHLRLMSDTQDSSCKCLLNLYDASRSLAVCVCVMHDIQLLCTCKDMTCGLHAASLVYSTMQTWFRKWLLETTASFAGVPASSSASLYSIL